MKIKPLRFKLEKVKLTWTLIVWSLFGIFLSMKLLHQKRMKKLLASRNLTK